MVGLNFIVCFFLSFLSVSAFYLPGVAPTSYKKDDAIPLLVNHLTPSFESIKANSKTYVYSFDYYYPKFHFCVPEGGPKKQSESLGSIIFGDRIFNSPFKINMLQNVTCQKLCTPKYSKTDSVFVNRNIRAGYKHNWLIDGLPAAVRLMDKRTNSEFYGSGFDIGFLNDDHKSHLFNHYEIYIEYHKRADNEFRVVGVTVDPFSMDRQKDAELKCSSDLPFVELKQDKETDVTFSYSVTFVESDTAWATRWDKYLHVYDPKIQWFSLINFSLIVVFLSIIIGHILLRTLRNDIVKYNEVNLDDDVQDESGWKLVHGDVFRPPKQRLLLSVIVGSGVQLFLMISVTVSFAVFGLLSPSNRGALATFMFILYTFFGAFGSFISGYLYKFFQGENWKLNMILTPLLVPGGIFAVFVFLNFFLIYEQSSGAIPVGTMFAIVFIWFLISVPLSVVGSIYAAKRPVFTPPVRTNQIPRQIPVQPWYLRTIPVTLISGIFPFGSIAVEMYFIYSSLWFNKVYYMFGFLFFCFILMVITCALVSILMIYYTLCSENYKWHWKSVFIGGGCSIYIFIHALFLTKFSLGDFVSFVLYVGYSAVISILTFICCGSMGFVASLFFVKMMYAQIKID